MNRILLTVLCYIETSEGRGTSSSPQRKPVGAFRRPPAASSLAPPRRRRGFGERRVRKPRFFAATAARRRRRHVAPAAATTPRRTSPVLRTAAGGPPPGGHPPRRAASRARRACPGAPEVVARSSGGRRIPREMEAARSGKLLRPRRARILRRPLPLSPAFRPAPAAPFGGDASRRLARSAASSESRLNRSLSAPVDPEEIVQLRSASPLRRLRHGVRGNGVDL